MSPLGYPKGHSLYHVIVITLGSLLLSYAPDKQTDRLGLEHRTQAHRPRRSAWVIIQLKHGFH